MKAEPIWLISRKLTANLEPQCHSQEIMPENRA